MNPNITKVMKLFSELSDDERLDVIDRIEEEYNIDIFVASDSKVSSSSSSHNRIQIRLSKGAIEHNYISLDKNFDFFPADTLGYTNKPPDKMIHLTIFGYPNPIDTYILQDKNRFHTRSLSQFFNEIKAKPGKFIVIEHNGEYNFHLYPLM